MSDGAASSATLDRLRELLATVGTSNPFYAEKLRTAGLDASVASVDEFIARMPFTTKDELVADQAAHPPHGTNLTFPPARYVRLHQTSSTSGNPPLRWLDTPESWSAMLDGWTEVFRAAGVTDADRLMVAFSFGPFIGLWMAFDAAWRMGCLTIPGGAMNSVTRLRVIMENRITVLCCTPTYALRLGETAEENDVDLHGAAVRAIIVGGEPGGSVPAIRERLATLWPTARIFDHYGMTEVGPVTYQCTEQTDVVHVLDEAFLAEVIDPDTGAPVARSDTPGTVAPGSGPPGELVLTTLTRTGSPVLRYRTGDLVRPRSRATCACGRTTLELAGGIIGRADDMVFVRGVNLYPSAIEQIVRSVAGVAEYRVEIDTEPTLTELHVLVEPTRPADGETLCRTLERAFRDAFNLRIPVTVTPEALPRFELKSKRWIKLSNSTS